jgi:hypothetical protein
VNAKAAAATNENAAAVIQARLRWLFDSCGSVEAGSGGSVSFTPLSAASLRTGTSAAREMSNGPVGGGRESRIFSSRLTDFPSW